MTFQHEGIKQIFHIEFFSFCCSQVNLGHGGCVCRGYCSFFQITLFQNQNAGHNFRGACHGSWLFCIFSIKHSSRGSVHKHCGQGMKVSWLCVLCRVFPIGIKRIVQNSHNNQEYCHYLFACFLHICTLSFLYLMYRHEKTCVINLIATESLPLLLP